MLNRNEATLLAAQRWRDPDSPRQLGVGGIMTQGSLLVGYLRSLLLEGKP